MHVLIQILSLTASWQPSSAEWPPPQLANRTGCADVGLDPWSFADAVALPDGSFLPVFATVPEESVTHALIVLHGNAGNANDYFCSALDVVGSAGVLPTTSVIAPWFPTSEVTLAQWSGKASTPGVLSLWNFTNNWDFGGNSILPAAHLRPVGEAPCSSELGCPQGGISSFTALDILVAWVRDRSPSSLKFISVAGFSGGAQLALRWGIFSPLGESGRLHQSQHMPSTMLSGSAVARDQANGGLRLRLILGDPGSFTYLSSERPGEECIPLLDSGVDHTCDTWLLPSNGTCNGTWDNFKYGLSGLDEAAKQVSYISWLADNATALRSTVDRFLSKDVRFILGNADVCNCNFNGFVNVPSCYQQNSCTPDTFGGPGCCDTSPDTGTNNVMEATCEAMLQGSNRLQRGLNYLSHLRQMSGMTYEPVHGIVNGGHDKNAFLGSKYMQKWAMGDTFQWLYT